MRIFWTIVIVLIVGFILILIGRKIYLYKNKNYFGDNVLAIIDVLKEELAQVDEDLANQTLTKEEKKKLSDRKNQIEKDLKQFTGV